MRATAPPKTPPLRADAARNRERILAAAEEVFLALGADASLEEVARRAEVGIGTLYRRFPTREDLLAAANNERLLGMAQASRARDASLDPAAAMRAFVAELVHHARHYRGLATSIGAVLHSGTPGCHACSEEGKRLLKHAQKAGAIRKDVSFDDIVCVVTAISLAVDQDASPQARIKHLVDVFLGGIETR